jgi:segregation and condensation protein B
MSEQNLEVTTPTASEETGDGANYMTRQDYEKAIEAILFAAGHPVTYEQLAKTFEIPTSEMRSIVTVYAEKYNTSELARGVILITYDTCCQLCTKPEYIGYIRTALGIKRSAGTLSASTIEALTIVAYKQPVTRAYIDSVRNADSSYAISNLLDRGLIEPKGRMDVPGRPILYGTTHTFLRSFGLNSLDDLPGGEGEASKIFAAIDSRINASANGDVDGQVSLDDVIADAFVAEESHDEPVVEQVTIGDVLAAEAEADAIAVEAEAEELPEEEETSATEEAERALDD